LVAYKAFDSLVLDKQDTILSGSLAKLVGSEGLWASVQDTMLLHGHSGYESGPIASLFRDIAGCQNCRWNQRHSESQYFQPIA